LCAVVVGGGHLDVLTGQAAQALGWPLLASYGMTEAASQIATQELSALEKLYQPAPIPLLPLWQAETVADGRLRIAGPALFSGKLSRVGEMWNYEPRLAEWHITEDNVIIDHAYLTPLGRADSLIKVLGELVNPQEIERELSTLSGGALAPGSFVVVPVPDTRTGNKLVAVFDIHTDASIIRNTLAAHAVITPGFRRLAQAVMLDPFPRSALGKPLRAEIAAAILKQP
jgi:O-succinylbenzoic acid--CoA ligase